jgi:hypothetical protein
MEESELQFTDWSKREALITFKTMHLSMKHQANRTTNASVNYILVKLLEFKTRIKRP